MDTTMQLFKSALLAGVACAIAAPGFAADLSRPVPYTKAPIAAPVAAYNWSGFYLGGNPGGKWASYDSTITTGTGQVLGFSGHGDASFVGGGQPASCGRQASSYSVSKVTSTPRVCTKTS